MADYRETYHDYLFTAGDSLDVKGRGLVNLLLENISGLSNSGRLTWASGRDNTLLTFPGCRSMGVGIFHADVVYMGVYYTTGSSSSGNLVLEQSIEPKSTDIGYRLIARRVGELTLYSVYTIGSDGKNNNFCGRFMDCSFVDHFTGTTRSGVAFTTDSTAIPTFYFYYDDAEDETKHTVYTATVIDPYGTAFPNREQIVVVPVLVAYPRASFFSYVESPTTLYKIYAGNQKLSVGLNVTIIVNGVRFVQLVKGLFVRIS